MDEKGANGFRILRNPFAPFSSTQTPTIVVDCATILFMPNEPVTSPNPKSNSSLARSAGILSIGNVASRVLGLMREMVIAAFFGQTGLVSAFTVASQVPTMLYDFLIGGMLSAALVPVLSQYATQRDADGKRTELTRLVGALISLLGMTLGRGRAAGDLPGPPDRLADGRGAGRL